MKWLRAVLPVTVLVASGVVAAPADAAPGWQKYVVAPSSRDVRPVRVLDLERARNPLNVVIASR